MVVYKLYDEIWKNGGGSQRVFVPGAQEQGCGRSRLRLMVDGGGRWKVCDRGRI